MSMNAVTSYDTSFRAGGISRPLSLSTSSLMFLMLRQFLTTGGLRLLARYLAALYVILPHLDTIGPSSVFLCVYLRCPIKFVGFFRLWV